MRPSALTEVLRKQWSATPIRITSPQRANVRRCPQSTNRLPAPPRKRRRRFVARERGRPFEAPRPGDENPDAAPETRPRSGLRTAGRRAGRRPQRPPRCAHGRRRRFPFSRRRSGAWSCEKTTKSSDLRRRASGRGRCDHHRVGGPVIGSGRGRRRGRGGLVHTENRPCP